MRIKNLSGQPLILSFYNLGYTMQAAEEMDVPNKYGTNPSLQAAIDAGLIGRMDYVDPNPARYLLRDELKEADEITFDPSDAGMVSTNVQDAITELKVGGSELTRMVTGERNGAAIPINTTIKEYTLVHTTGASATRNDLWYSDGSGAGNQVKRPPLEYSRIIVTAYLPTAGLTIGQYYLLSSNWVYMIGDKKNKVVEVAKLTIANIAAAQNLLLEGPITVIEADVIITVPFEATELGTLTGILDSSKMDLQTANHYSNKLDLAVVLPSVSGFSTISFIVAPYVAGAGAGFIEVKYYKE